VNLRPPALLVALLASCVLHSAAQPAADPLQAQVLAAERAGLDALQSGDLARFGKLTASEAIFVDAAGIASKDQVMKNVEGFALTGYQMDGIQFERLSAKSGLISYHVVEKGNSHGHDFTASVYVSSIWAKRGRQWVCLFSQETAAPAWKTPAGQ
jgi:ketosteroid isomerase-like protein